MKEKRKLKKVVLVAIILLLCLIALTGNVKAASYSRETIKERFNTIRNMQGFRAGEVSKYQEDIFHSSHCDSWHGGYQCYGHALAVFDYLFEQCADCQESTYDVNNLCVGDVVRIYDDSHSIVVQDIRGDIVYFTDANVLFWGAEQGVIRWNASMTKSELASCLTYIKHAPGNNIKTFDNGEQPFYDIYVDEWYYSAVKYNFEHGIIKGMNDNTFSPNTNLTRGMLVTILNRMEGSPKAKRTSKFTDVQDRSKYYYNSVVWATENKIVSGYDNGNFGPNDPITREQLAIMLNKYCRYKGKYKETNGDLSKFKDANKIASYAVSQMKWAVGTGVITGNATTLTINPKGNATRAEVASMLYKYCTRVK